MKPSVLTEALSAENIEEIHIKDMSQNICQVCNLSLTSVAFTKNIIYVVTAPVLLEVGDGCLEAPSIFILLGNLNDFIDMQKPENYIIYQSDAPGEVFTALLSKLNLESRILEAELAISRALFDCTSIKDLLDVAASILGNPILLQDFTTRLLVHSANEVMAADDEILNSVFRMGYVTSELFQKYDYANVLEQIKNTPQTFLLKSPKKRERLICRLIVNRRYFGWFLTVAYNHPFKDSDIEIMNFLCGALQLFLEKENILPNTTRSENLLQELIQDAKYSEAEFKKRAEGFSWMLHDHYYIIAISDKTGKAESRMMMSYRNHLSLIFPEVIILEVNRKLILFFDTKEVGICLNVLEAFLEKYDLLAVCSNQFHKITDFAYILNQLLMVIGLEKSLHFNKSLIHYQDYIMYCAIKKIGREGHIQYFCMPELLEVFRYDHKYGTSFAYSKRIALELASVTAAAQKLGIHRNTMEYRLRKFNDLSGISNYTADIVERLLFTYKILDLYPEIIEEKDIL